MKNYIKALAIAGAIITGAPSGGMAQDIIVVSHGQALDGFWARVKNGVTQAAEDTGATVSYRAPETFNMVEMAALIDAAVTQEPDGLVVSIPDTDALGPSIMRAVEAGIPVISMNTGSDVAKSLGILLHVGMDEYKAGMLAGERLAAAGGTNAICINNEVGNVALDQRCKGFEDGFGGTSSVLPSSVDPGETKSKVSAALLSNPDIDTILATDAQFGGGPAVEAVNDNERGDSVTIGSFDLTPGILESVKSGEVLFAIDQQQYLQGYLPVSFLALHAKFGLMPFGNVDSGPNLVTSENAGATIQLSADGIR